MDANAYLLVGLAVTGIGAAIGVPLALLEGRAKRASRKASTVPVLDLNFRYVEGGAQSAAPVSSTDSASATPRPQQAAHQRG